MERRLFLKVAASCLGTLAFSSGLHATPSDEPYSASDSWRWLGARAREGLPVADITLLEEEGERLIAALGGDADFGESLKPTLEQSVASDFRNGRTVRVGGVTFARTEVALFLLASRPALA